MRSKTFIFSLLLSAGILLSCEKDPYRPWNPNRNGKDTTSTDKPDIPEPPKPEGQKGKSRYVWVSCEGNWEEFANSESNIIREIGLLKDCGFTDLVVDVRPTNGGVLFKSTHAEPQRRMDC